MHRDHCQFLCCPVTRTPLRLQVISTMIKKYDGLEVEIVKDGLLFASADWVYPVIDGIPRLIVEAFLDYEQFLTIHLADYREHKNRLEKNYPGILRFVLKKNRRTKESFAQEWSVFDYSRDKTWDAAPPEMFQRFLLETGESTESLAGKFILDAGCGNGLLNQSVAAAGATVLGMDFSKSIERAFEANTYAKAIFVQGDIQFPPVHFGRFDLVHCSGVLIHTNNSELSFSCIEPCIRPGGKLSVWLYQHRSDRIHRLFNRVRGFSSKLPLRLQYYLYLSTLFPLSYLIKKIKGNSQTRREMIIDILDWFTPEFRWEHYPDEVSAWFWKRNYRSVQVTTRTLFGFNMTGTKSNSKNAVEP